MADPSIYAASAVAAANAEAAATAEESSPALRRGLHSVGGTASAAALPAEAIAQPSPPSRRKQPNKRIFIGEIDGIAPALMEARNNLHDGARVAAAAPSYLCDWAQAIQCQLTDLAPEPCRKEGCEVLVHHLCQGEWERRFDHEEVVPRYCCHHHPNYKY